MKTLCHFGFPNQTEVKTLEKLASQYGLEYQFIHTSEDTFRAAGPIMNAALVCIWNGKQLGSSLMTELCESRGIPKFHLEWGMLPQSETYFVDPNGFCGDSILNTDLSWVNDQDIQTYKQLQKQLQEEYTVQDDGYILVPLQRSTDSQILYYTKYNNMTQFIEEVQNMYPNIKIMIKPHPREPNIALNFDTTNTIIKNPSTDFLELASKASVVVGLTSTSLYEAAILGKKVVSLGDHPLANNLLEDRERLLAGITALTINRNAGDIKSILERFGIEPRKG